MARRTMRAVLVLSQEDKTMLSALAGSRKASVREVQRARILLTYAQGQSPTQIQRALGTSRPTIYKCIDKALAMGVAAGLQDRYHRPHPPQITDEARAWVVDLACRKPKELGYAAELWTLSALAAHVRANAHGAGFASLERAGKSTVWRILDAPELKPHRVHYYPGAARCAVRAQDGRSVDGLSRRGPVSGRCCA